MSISDNQIMQYFLSALAVFNTYCRKGQWGFNPLIKQQLQPRLLELVTFYKEEKADMIMNLVT
jgi:hypothetical protein